MNLIIKDYDIKYIADAIDVWNEIILEGNSFPQDKPLSEYEGHRFFRSQTYTGIAYTENGEPAGLYILHPNNVGRCSHICNASYAVKSATRGLGVGEFLVRHCIAKAKVTGFSILQFNAVVATNIAALKLYKKLGFTQLGVIPGGFRLNSGEYEDIIPHFILL